MNPMQKYPHIIELFARILNMFAFCVCMSNNFFNFFRNMFNPKTVKKNNLKIFTCKAIQCVPTPGYSPRFIIYSPSFIFLDKLSLE